MHEMYSSLSLQALEPQANSPHAHASNLHPATAIAASGASNFARLLTVAQSDVSDMTMHRRVIFDFKYPQSSTTSSPGASHIYSNR
jgi:hypothetical protein